MTQVKKGEGLPEEIILRRCPGEAAAATTTGAGQSATKPEASSTTNWGRGIGRWKGSPSESWQCAAAAGVNEPEEQRWRRRRWPGGRVLPRPGNKGSAGRSETGKT